MNNTETESKLDQLLGKQIAIVNKIKKSSGHIDAYAGCTGILKSYTYGDSKGEISVNVAVEVTLGKKVKRVEQVSLWIDSRDIVGFES